MHFLSYLIATAISVNAIPVFDNVDALDSAKVADFSNSILDFVRISAVQNKKPDSSTTFSSDTSEEADSEDDSDDEATAVPVNKQFNILTYHEGVPYLHMRPLLLTTQNELVVNADSGSKVFMGFLSENQTLVSAHEQNQANATIAVFPNGALKLSSPTGSKTATAASPNVSKSVASKGLNVVEGNTVGPWTYSSNETAPSFPSSKPTVKGQFLILGNASNAWSCPKGKSGIYQTFWTTKPDVRPQRQYGCIKVDLFVPDQPLITTKN